MAFVSPPYGDLFDYAWQVDGQAVATGPVGMLQVPAASPSPGGRRAAHGAGDAGVRQYPDPALPHVPPTLTSSAH